MTTRSTMNLGRLVGVDRAALERPSSSSSSELASETIMGEISRIAEASRGAVTEEDLALAFVTLRAHLDTDENALEVLGSVARQAREMGVDASTLASMLAEASKPPAERNRVVVPGGMRGPELPPGIELGAGVDPRAAELVGRGRALYHLDTLAELEAESRREPRRRPAPMRPRGAMLMLGAAAMMAAVGVASCVREDDDEPPAAPRRGPLVQTRLSPSREEKAPRASSSEPRERKPGCRSAGCRTLADCLCTCGDCEVDCYDRKPRRA